jgi:methylglutaconyl-CoA hydratase
MDYRTLVVEIKYGIGIVWMNRPKLKNVLDETVIVEMTAAMRALDNDPAVRAVVLAGAGASFCAGADLNWMQRMAGSRLEQNRADAMNFASLLQTINTLKKPTIARVHGSAFAGGIGLVAACDMAVAACEAEFCLSEVRLGLIPATIAPYVIRAMGERMARRYFLSAEPFPAAEAYRIGLVSDIAPLEELDTRINELLGLLIQGGPNAQALTKEWVRAVAGAPITDDLVKESAARLAGVRASEEGQEGIRSFLEKRNPIWFAQAKKSITKKTGTPKARRTK